MECDGQVLGVFPLVPTDRCVFKAEHYFGYFLFILKSHLIHPHFIKANKKRSRVLAAIAFVQ